MQDFLTAIEGTALSIWVRESDSIWSYPMIVTVHAWGMALLVGIAAALDLRLLGMAADQPLAPMKKLVPIMRLGFVLSLLSGIALTIGDAGSMLISPLFYLKMLLVAVALVVTWRIERLLDKPDLAAASGLTGGRTLAICSLVLWTAAITAGRLTAYFGPAVALKGITH
jgi:hypothetical protein